MLLVTLSGRVGACPFCTPVDADLFSEVRDAQTAVLVVKLEANKYSVKKVLKGGAKLGQVILSAQPRGRADQRVALLSTTAGPATSPFWPEPPRYLNSVEFDFVSQALKLGNSTEEATWDFALNYLESPSNEVAVAAYGVLAAAPLKKVQDRAKRVGLERLSSWSQNSAIPDDRRALYTLMSYPFLNSKQLLWTTKTLFSSRVSSTSPLVPALVIGHLQLTGVEGLARVRDRLLSPEVPAARTKPVVRALTLVGEQTQSPALKEAIITLFLKELEHPDRGVFVIAPLAIWRVERAAPLVEALALKKNQVEWVKVASIRYFRSFSSPQASDTLNRLAAQSKSLVESTRDPYRLSDLSIE